MLYHVLDTLWLLFDFSRLPSCGHLFEIRPTMRKAGGCGSPDNSLLKIYWRFDKYGYLSDCGQSPWGASPVLAGESILGLEMVWDGSRHQ